MHRIIQTTITAVGLMMLVASASGQTASDHLACYLVKDSARKGRSSLTLMNAGVTQSCTTGSRAQLACLATPGSGGDFLCYRLFCAKPFPPAAQMTDQLAGTRVVKLKATTFLCAPATRSAGTVGSTTTTTLASGSCDFDSDTRQCVGTCGNGGHCSAVTSGGACECRTTPCGDADAPECNGFCDAGKACTFDITGCSCFDIP